MLDDNELLFDELYEETKDCGRVQFINLIMNLQKENQELKKQLSNDHQIKIKRLQQENRKLKQQLSNSHQIKNQQKEFIQWLENESKEVIRDAGYHQRICLEILSKYKEIIGGDNK